MATIYTDESGQWYGGNAGLNQSQQHFNADTIKNWMAQNGWSYNAICAILGNMSFESTENPQRQEVGGSGYGLVQWTPKSNLQKRARAIGRYGSYDTMYTQLLVIEYEVEHRIQWIPKGEYQLSFQEFKTDSTHSIDWLTRAFMLCYERPRDQSETAQNERVNGDNDGHIGSLQWDSYFQGGGGSSGSIDGFLNWCATIANDNRYLYRYGSAHGVPWDYSGYYFDCSSFISFGLHNGGGYALETQFSTATQKEELEELGFTAIAYTNKSQLQRGDILVTNRNSHTEAVYSVNGDAIQLVGAHTDTVPPDAQISIINFYEYNWDWILRGSGVVPPKPPFLKRNRTSFIPVWNKRRH